MLAYYRALWDRGVDIDVLPVTADLSGYDVVVAPVLYLVKGDQDPALKRDYKNAFELD